MRPKLRLAHLPTPLWHSTALDAALGTTVWVKRDDMTAGAEAGNKIRKLEYLLAEALERGATWIVTCGAVQSNHARATALLAALTAYVRATGGALGLAQDFRGPMAKPHRMAVLTVGCLVGAAEIAWNGTRWALLAAAIVIAVGSALTCVTRALAIGRTLRAR